VPVVLASRLSLDFKRERNQKRRSDNWQEENDNNEESRRSVTAAVREERRLRILPERVQTPKTNLVSSSEASRRTPQIL